ncbi:MAG: hypothetical protein M3357_02040 [Actinomycetota bacterium]|nr:hypothetical protein [Actinomycetota bacterium]
MALAGPRSLRGGLTFLDGEMSEVILDSEEAKSLVVMLGGFERVTVSACPGCRSRILAAVALVDLLDAAPPHPRAPELVELADEAPTLHVYLVDEGSDCRHERWLDPGFDEWTDAVND